MQTPHLIAKQCKEFYFGKNWTWVSLKDTLSDVDHKMALHQVGNFNTIATLTFHIHYYVTGVTTVLKGGPLTIKDKYAFDHPPIHSEEDWQKMLAEIWKEAEEFVELIEKIEPEQLSEDLDKPIYGSYYRNLSGIIEHGHYHLGQIVFLKKMIPSK